MKNIKKIMIAGLFACMLAACSTPETVTTYYLSDERYSSDITMTLTASSQTEGTFQIVFPDTRTLPYGKYTIEDGVLTCTTFDKYYRFRFQVNDDGTYTFIANGSTESIADGAVFYQEKQSADDSDNVDSAE